MFWNCCEELNNSGCGVPSLQIVNGILTDHDAGYEIQPPCLVATCSYTPINVPRQAPSLDEQAHTFIDQCLVESERLMAAG
jgi:hypothetical protein